MSKLQINGLAIIAGTGDLPRFLAEEAARIGRLYQVVCFGPQLFEWTKDHPFIFAEFEKPAALFKALKRTNCKQVVFAGSMARPRLNPLKFDWKFLKIAPRLLPALKNGDDVTLRVITMIFESEGFVIIGADSLLNSLLAKEGCLTNIKPNDTDKADLIRAIEITEKLGQVDIGQAVVVAQGICLGVESIQGTDALLNFVAQTAEPFRLHTDGAMGLLYKAAKQSQDRRVDLPSIGADTIRNAHRAGLAGVVLEANNTLILGLDETIEVANKLGLFLWVRP